MTTRQDVMDAARSFASACDAAWLLAKSDAERRTVENLFRTGMYAVEVANKQTLAILTGLVEAKKEPQ